MRHKEASVRLRWTGADQRRLGADRRGLRRPLRPLFNPAVRALLAAIAATALGAAPADARTISAPSFWTTQRVEGGVAALIADRSPYYAKNIRVDSVRCQTGGSRRWFCTIR